MFDRRLLACVALLLIASAASAQTPAATLTLTDTARTASASGGPFFVPNETYTAALVLELANMGNSDSFICDALANPCYVVQLNVSLPADYAQLHPTDRSASRSAGIRRRAISTCTSTRLRTTPPSARRSASRATTRRPPRSTEFPVTSGTSTYRVYVVPSIPAAVSATVTASLVTGPTPTQSTTVKLGATDLRQLHAAHSVSTRTDRLTNRPSASTSATNKAYMLFNFDVLEASFDDSTSPAAATWRNLGTGGAPTTADPFMTMDQHRLPDGSVNHRVWIAQLLAASSYMALQRQSGKPARGRGRRPDRARCTASTTSRSPPVRIRTTQAIDRAVGRELSARDLLLLAQRRECVLFAQRRRRTDLQYQQADLPARRRLRQSRPRESRRRRHRLRADEQLLRRARRRLALVDAGETWHYITVPGDGRAAAGTRRSPSPTTARRSTTATAKQGDDRPMIIKGTLDKSDPDNPTILWQEPAVDVGAPAGLANIVFPTVVAGDPGRAAFIFHGTTTEGDSGDHGLVPGERRVVPVRRHDLRRRRDVGAEQRHAERSDAEGSICDRGTGCDNDPDDRNLLDFMDADIDGQGRIIIGYADGCIDACVIGGPDSVPQPRLHRAPGHRRAACTRVRPGTAGEHPGQPVAEGLAQYPRRQSELDLSRRRQRADHGFNIERTENGGCFRVLGDHWPQRRRSTTTRPRSPRARPINTACRP